MDMETLIGAIEQRKRIAERNNQAFEDLPYEIVGEVLELLKEQEAEIEKLNRFVNGFSRDAIPVVRCKDCIYKEEHPSPYWKYWCNRLKCGCDDDWFCADGEHKECR